ncbi:hypothetical protein IW261DRAFT_1426414 [Armillaria novae-zelandiae]|uniref:Uncharacterized protein n=1 Tax=Armillaria novae-zelandiae TaxID=153914 RepID=A0AA39NLH4_9AGAR|nr:hypothetical protein IW261DRAFT_1426414 [Armillaria novae-zelandiae]
MAVIPDIPDLSEADIQIIFKITDMEFNTTLLEVFCSGIYTAIIAITMWTVFSAKHTIRGLASHAMIFIILCLYVLNTLSAPFHWAFNQRALIDNGWNFWTVFLSYDSISSPLNTMLLMGGVSGLLSTLAADGSMDEPFRFGDAGLSGVNIGWLFSYPSYVFSQEQGIAPTLIVGRVAAGHTRPDESWEGSISSSLHFGHSSEDLSQGTIDSDVEGGTLSREERQSSVIHADSHEERQEVSGQEDETGQVVYIEIV